jgi:hypothetical protein
MISQLCNLIEFISNDYLSLDEAIILNALFIQMHHLLSMMLIQVEIIAKILLMLSHQEFSISLPVHELYL